MRSIYWVCHFFFHFHGTNPRANALIIEKKYAKEGKTTPKSADVGGGYNYNVCGTRED
jgi:hypothetical protein